MQVDEDVKNEWLELKEHGDTKKIAKLLKIAPQNASVIIHTGIGRASQIAAIQKFFKARKKLVQQIENDLN